jgi:hypothetical protein
MMIKTSLNLAHFEELSKQDSQVYVCKNHKGKHFSGCGWRITSCEQVVEGAGGNLSEDL